MDVAIRGDRTCCLTMQLSAQTWLFAVAQGFGSVDGSPIAQLTLSRLRAECERRLRNERFRGAIGRSQAAAASMLGVLARVNGDLFTRAAAHDDYVAAGCSFTAALIVGDRAYVLHAGGTAAYLAHAGEVTALTADDCFDDSSRPLLARALGTAASLDVAVSSAVLEPGDVMILVGHRIRGGIDRQALIAHVEGSRTGEHLLVVRFDDDDRRMNEPPVAPASVRIRRLLRWLAAAAGAIAAFATTGWTR